MFTVRPFRIPLAGLSLLAALLLASESSVLAQTPAPDPQAAATDPAVLSVPVPPEIDLNLIDLPTTLSLKSHHSYFRLTHRFARDLRRGAFTDLASSLFSLDDGAVIGLEYRYAITGHVHVGANRSMLAKTIQTFVRWDALRQGAALPISVSLMGSYEGLNNLRQNHQPGVALTVSRTFGDALALYATPAFVMDTHAVDTISGHSGHEHDLGLDTSDNHANHKDTWFAGLGTRVRFSRSGYVVAEFTPRLAGYDPNKGVWGVAIEKRTGGHTLQLNFTNSFGTTLGQLARGGSPHDVYLGFNITRKF
ncbi:MAG: hypothetical protein V7647_947 [Acidobacteriota bacterium]|jgi:hypothetical protein